MGELRGRRHPPPPSHSEYHCGAGHGHGDSLGSVTKPLLQVLLGRHKVQDRGQRQDAKSELEFSICTCTTCTYTIAPSKPRTVETFNSSQLTKKRQQILQAPDNS
eukprot:GHVT01012212.1.p1 GENE.GHVT01012212.1~~GHVT01012212.1.p1  ORF type:complete len:105 (-),score=6.80 GHVT01012212.1:424-738(-)